ncbi:MAG: FecR domain-containing protein [Pelomonas sp.]|nr:FecR domain-containing protein [Burkholderiaceae bacterium]MBV8605046.1 FecR domain-containing protein [Roseateles sp.]
MTLLCAATAHAESAGMVKTLKGQANIARAGQILPAQIGDPVMEGDQISTGADSSIGITLRDDTMLAAGAHSALLIKRFAFNPTTHDGQLDSSVKRGTLAVISGKIAKTHPDAVQFSTNSITLGVRGTEFIIDAGDGP